MPHSDLENLVRIGQLKPEPQNLSEVKRMIEMAKRRIADAYLANASTEGRFASAYSAGHVYSFGGFKVAWLSQRK